MKRWCCMKIMDFEEEEDEEFDDVWDFEEEEEEDEY